MGFIEQLFKGFFRSAVNQVGKDGGRVISNKIYNGNNSTPLRNLSKEEVTKKENLLTDICELLKIEKEGLISGIQSGNFNINISFNTKNDILIDLKNKSEQLYSLLLDETHKSNFNSFYIKIVETIQQETKKEKLTLKFEKELSVDDFNQLLDGKYFIGMTEEMVKESFGGPTKVEVEVLKSKTKKTYIYGNKNSGDVLVFENGKLTKFKDR